MKTVTMTNRDYERLNWCIERSKIIEESHEKRTKRLHRMSFLARTGQKDSREFKELERADMGVTVIDLGGITAKLAGMKLQ